MTEYTPGPEHEAAAPPRDRPSVEWTEALAVGVGLIDDQHQGLFARLNEIERGIRAGWDQEARNNALRKLVDDTLVHFESEEILMRMHQYPQEKMQEHQHDRLIQMIEQYLIEYERDPNPSNPDLLNFLEKWLVEHILKDDKKLGHYLVEKGVT